MPCLWTAVPGVSAAASLGNPTASFAEFRVFLPGGSSFWSLLLLCGLCKLSSVPTALMPGAKDESTARQPPSPGQTHVPGPCQAHPFTNVWQLVKFYTFKIRRNIFLQNQTLQHFPSSFSAAKSHTQAKTFKIRTESLFHPYPPSSASCL